MNKFKWLMIKGKYKQDNKKILTKALICINKSNK